MDSRIGFCLLAIFTVRALGGVIPYLSCHEHCDKCIKNQTIDLDLKCGSDGVVYLNECELNCAREHCNSSLKLEHDGLCGDVTPKGVTLYSATTSEIASNSTAVIPEAICDPYDDCDCTYDLLLTCGTDGETYPNECVLKCGQKCNKELKILHYGACYAG